MVTDGARLAKNSKTFRFRPIAVRACPEVSESQRRHNTVESEPCALESKCSGGRAPLPAPFKIKHVFD